MFSKIMIKFLLSVAVVICAGYAGGQVLPLAPQPTASAPLASASTPKVTEPIAPASAPAYKAAAKEPKKEPKKDDK